MRYLIIIGIIGSIFLYPQEGLAKLISKEQAIKVGRKTKEVKSLYKLDRGRFSSCIVAKVDKPCESNWVTCIEDAWVVKFLVGEKCGVAHDGRLSVTLLVDAKNSKVISRFPENEYFPDPLFCHDSIDCMSIPRDYSSICRNFIHAPLMGAARSNDGRCQCVDSVCQSKR